MRTRASRYIPSSLGVFKSNRCLLISSQAFRDSCAPPFLSILLCNGTSERIDRMSAYGASPAVSHLAELLRASLAPCLPSFCGRFKLLPPLPPLFLPLTRLPSSSLVSRSSVFNSTAFAPSAKLEGSRPRVTWPRFNLWSMTLYLLLLLLFILNAPTDRNVPFQIRAHRSYLRCQLRVNYHGSAIEVADAAAKSFHHGAMTAPLASFARHEPAVSCSSPRFFPP